MHQKVPSTAEVVGAAFLALAVPIFVAIGIVAVSVIGRY